MQNIIDRLDLLMEASIARQITEAEVMVELRNISHRLANDQRRTAATRARWRRIEQLQADWRP